MAAAVSQLGIDFIGNHDEIMFFHHLGNRLPILTAHDRSCRIAGITENKDFGTRGNLGFQPLGGQLEIVLPERLNAYRNPSAYCCNRRVGNITRLRNKNLISGRDQGAQRQINRFTPAYCGNDLIGRIIFYGEAGVQVFGDAFPQLRHARIRGIAGEASLQRINAGFPDMPRRLEVRLPNPKGDNIFAACRQIKKLADARRLNLLDQRGQIRMHGFACISGLLTVIRDHMITSFTEIS
ncbi:hypothetical protein D3C73_652050 [compost metagenome]